MSTLSFHSESPAPAANYPQPPAFTSSVTLRHLRSAREIASVLSLRNEIDLSVHAGSPEFRTLEKKETKSVSWAHSRCTGRSSAPSAWFPWGTTSR
jgi:hypothetical protein